ncbi:hypothetical protein AZF37_08995 [endosymbiont 'TC1' of Trimyema compressum]|uniref:type III pantothenate kinase n=1 Tax=endosymbiont 'TC1' of Trimyema compressum TaxID=243899 RepID=UPI0007F11EFE|nr:type III pantothenate kinase [endosymbiont 'TC1' of Trimyema compressum]AMP21260.1 hypothetical protein AZF37_08995 [endosymbiont 'TC1' of Trimyema compressum]
MFNKNKVIHNCFISSVVPKQSQVFSQIVEETLNLTPIFVDTTFKSNINIGLENPETLGNDRFANNIGAQSLYPNKHLLVIDFGTAITYDYINENGILSFGLITLGIESTLKSLSQNTAQLPQIEALQKKGFYTGKNTKESIAAGLYYSKIGEVNHIINSLK